MNEGHRDEEIRAYWEDPNSVSMYDEYLADLEAVMLSRHFTADDDVLDLGCGDGTGSLRYRNRVRTYTAIERSSMMLERFRSRGSNCTLVRADIRKLSTSEVAQSRFSAVVTQRCLINLPDADTQRSVLQELPDLLRQGGKLLICEAFKEGVDHLNGLRSHLGCKPIRPKWHNVHLERSLTAEALGNRMELVTEEDLSWYYLLTRVVNQAFAGDSAPKWDSPVNTIAYQLAQSGKMPGLLGYSSILLQVWRLKG